MEWVHQYQVFLFDLDGLLVNTEELHFEAYRKMCSDRGFDLDWDFATYCQAAHINCAMLREKICEKLPGLQEFQWEELYQEKKDALEQIMRNGSIELMPGVEQLLEVLESANIKRSVVTHSSDQHVSLIREKNPVLDTIPTWFTRETYTHPKPHPEGYQKAIDALANPEDQVIGFEDTPKGLRSLLGTRAKPVMVTKVRYPETSEFLEKGILWVDDLAAVSM